MNMKSGLSLCLVLLAMTTARVVAQQPVSESEAVTLTGTIEAIDKVNRIVTLKGPGRTVDVKAPPEMEGFTSLRVGDQVTATYFEAMVVSVRKPGQPAPPADPATTVTRKDRTPGGELRKEQTFTVTIENINPPSVTLRGPQGRVLQMAVRDQKQLQNLKVGDKVDVTYYESLLVKVTRKMP